MDQEIYDAVLQCLDGCDQRAAIEVATFLAFHYPDEGRVIVSKFAALEPPTPPATPGEQT